MTTLSPLLLPSPESDDHVRLWEHIADLADAVQTLLGDVPDPVTGYLGGTNTFTGAASTWANLPTSSPTCVMTNPSASLDLLCDVSWGAWMSDTVGSTRLCITASGGLSIAAGVGLGGPVGWGEIPLSSEASASQHRGGCTVLIPAGAAAVTFGVQGYRSVASGTQNINYVAIRVNPLRFVAP